MQARSFATARPSALLRGYAPGLFIPTRFGPRFLESPGQRGSPRRRQCSEHLTVRSRAGRVDAQTACKPRATNSRPQEPLPLRQSASPATSLTKSETKTNVSEQGTSVNNKVNKNATLILRSRSWRHRLSRQRHKTGGWPVSSEGELF